MRAGFEGGQMPLQRRLPKRGFNNIFRKEIVAVNVADLNARFEDGAVVTVNDLLTVKSATQAKGPDRKKGIIGNSRDGVKILGNGELTKKLTVQANAFSAKAIEKIEALGGKAEVI